MKTFVLGSLKEYRQRRKTYEGDNLVMDMGQKVRDSCTKNDRDFID